MKRVLVVPWSSAPTYSATSYLLAGGALPGPPACCSRCQCVPQGLEQDRRARRARVLVPGRAFAEIARSPLAGDDRGDAIAALGRRVCGRLERLRQALVDLGLEGVHGGAHGVDHGLVAELRLAARDDAVEAGPDRVGELARRDLGRVTERGAGPQEERSVERPRRPANGRDELHRRLLQERSRGAVSQSG